MVYVDPFFDELQITLFYPERGFLIRYKIHGERLENRFIGDPSKATVDLWLYSPDVGNKFYDLDSIQRNWETALTRGKSLEESFAMTVEEFYKAFKEPSGLLLQTPLDIWLIY